MNLVEEISDFFNLVHPLESKVQSQRFSYLLGFNLKESKICAVKLYIRLFEKHSSFINFFNILHDTKARHWAQYDFSLANDFAFQNNNIGFKGFTLGIAKDLDGNIYSGWGSRLNFEGEVLFEGYECHEQYILSKQYEYKHPSNIPTNILKKFKYLTNLVEVQTGHKHQKYCLCPEITKSNVDDVDKKMQLNLSSHGLEFHGKLQLQNKDLKFVNFGISTDGEEKLYYFNKKIPNKIKNLLYSA